MKIIFMAGVHGVGKGTLSNKLQSKYKLDAYSASDLIKKEKKAQVDINKVVQNPNANQDHLNNAVKKLNINSERIILDGHFCLNSENGIFKVSLSTFESLNLEVIFLVIEKPNIIHNRLVSRDGTAMAVEIIESLQRVEAIHAKKTAKHLNIPLIISEQGNIKKFEDFLNNL